jgi:hypothetical protein
LVGSRETARTPARLLCWTQASQFSCRLMNLDGEVCKNWPDGTFSSYSSYSFPYLPLRPSGSCS